METQIITATLFYIWNYRNSMTCLIPKYGLELAIQYSIEAKQWSYEKLDRATSASLWMHLTESTPVESESARCYKRRPIYLFIYLHKIPVRLRHTAGFELSEAESLPL
jgi:hypothetical protein